MGTINWNDVYQQAIGAVTKVLGGSWTAVAAGAQHSVQVLVDTAAYIETHKDTLDADDYKLLVTNQKLAMQNVLLGYQEIGIAMAEQAVAAAWSAIGSALQTAVSFA